MITPGAFRDVLILLAAILAMIYVHNSEAQSASRSVIATWNAPTERENGDPLAPGDLAGYKLNLYDDTGQLLQAFDVTGTSFVIDANQLSADYGAFNFSMGIHAIDSGGLLSEESDRVDLSINGPSKPSNFRLEVRYQYSSGN